MPQDSKQNYNHHSGMPQQDPRLSPGHLGPTPGIRPAHQQCALDELVWLVPHDLPVLAGTRLALISIHNKVAGASGRGGLTEQQATSSRH